MTRIFRMQIKPVDPVYKTLDELMFKSKNLYNVCLYTERQLFFQKRDCKEPEVKAAMKGFLDYGELVKYLQNSDNPDYRALPVHVSQNVCNQAVAAFKSFFTKHKNGDTRCRMPRYKHKTKGRNRIAFTRLEFSAPFLRDGVLKFTAGVAEKTGLEDFELELRHYLPEGARFQQLHVVPTRHGTFEVIVIYRVHKPRMKEDNGNYMGIDLGVSNLATVVCSNSPTPVIFDGRKPKSVNQYYNKRMAYLQSVGAGKKKKNHNNIPFTRQMKRLLKKRNNVLNDYMHKVSKGIIDLALKNNTNTIIIGRNTGWKQNADIGKVNNQNFTNLPHHKLISMITYKAEQQGLTVVCTEESYTSKCSFLDNESIEHHEHYKGTRKPRGIFTTSKGFRINSDVNGALNIIRKVKAMFNVNTIEPAIVGWANPLRKIMVGGVLQIRRHPSVMVTA